MAFHGASRSQEHPSHDSLCLGYLKRSTRSASQREPRKFLQRKQNEPTSEVRRLGVSSYLIVEAKPIVIDLDRCTPCPSLTNPDVLICRRMNPTEIPDSSCAGRSAQRVCVWSCQWCGLFFSLHKLILRLLRYLLDIRGSNDSPGSLLPHRFAGRGCMSLEPLPPAAVWRYASLILERVQEGIIFRLSLHFNLYIISPFHQVSPSQES